MTRHQLSVYYSRTLTRRRDALGGLDETLYTHRQKNGGLHAFFQMSLCDDGDIDIVAPQICR